MFQIGDRFIQRRNPIHLRSSAAAQPLQLWKDEPDPVSALLPAPKFSANALDDVLLRIHEALQIEWVVNLLYSAVKPKNTPRR